MKKIVKILNAVLLVTLFLSVFTSVVFADSVTPGSVNVSASINSSGLVNVGGYIVTMIRTVGIVVSVGILLVLGIKYMMASPEGKADYKGSMIPYLVGAVLVFAGSMIASAVYEMINSASATI